MGKKNIDVMWRYVFWTYLVFWLMILGLGGTAALVFQAPPAVMNIIVILCSWSPTLVLLGMLKRLKPGMTAAGFYRGAFSGRVSAPRAAVAAFLVFGTALGAAALQALTAGTALATRLVLPSAPGAVLLLTALQGPSGEESGWRGYLRPELEGRFGFMKGNFLLGLIWAFWHTPLWFVASDYSGVQALIYIAANIIVMTDLTFIMGLFMKRSENLFIPFWIHFCFNFSLRFIKTDVLFFVLISAIYTAVTLMLLLSRWSRRAAPYPVRASR